MCTFGNWLVRVAIVAWLMVVQACTFLDHPPKPPIQTQLVGGWVGPSSRSEVWSVVLDPNGGGNASVVRLADKHAENLAVRSWRLDDFDFELVIDAPEAMRAQEPVMKLRGKASGGSIELRYKSKYWDRTIILAKESDFKAAIAALSAQ